jgi:protein-S-isoprenylcysteine O-methyltransferase Ste14
MTELDARKIRRRGAWIKVITGAVVSLSTAGTLLTDAPQVFRLIGAVLLIVAVVVFVIGCRQLLRSRTT